ncbi:MAG: hypothetical protein GQ524_01940 [Anaerolineales bacterium]|nr:hypothetical protein [Anaerolineales bacterium]
MRDYENEYWEAQAHINELYGEIAKLKAKVIHLEFTLELEDAWDKTEHVFFADFLVEKIERLQETIRDILSVLEEA